MTIEQAILSAKSKGFSLERVNGTWRTPAMRNMVLIVYRFQSDTNAGFITNFQIEKLTPEEFERYHLP